jgi:hypothetical protein
VHHPEQAQQQETDDETREMVAETDQRIPQPAVTLYRTESIDAEVEYEQCGGNGEDSIRISL